MEESYVETKVEALGDNRHKVTVTVAAKDIDARIKKTYKDFANKYNFPGFRKGKAPRPVIDNALGKEAVRATVTDDVVNGITPVAIDDSGLRPIEKPRFDEDPGLVQGGSDYTFSFSVAVKPEIELSNYDAVDIELPAENATEKEINDQIEMFRDHYATLEDAPANTKVKPDSEITIALSAKDDKGEQIASLTTESRPYGLGAGLFPAEFDEKLVGLKKGQKAEFTLDMPDEPPIMLSALQGKTDKIDFEVEVKAVRKRVLPEVTDEWAKDVLGFVSVEDLHKRLEESLTAQKKAMMPRLKESACLAKLAERVDVDAPAAMVEEAESTLLQDFFQQMQQQGLTFDAYLAQQGLTADQFKEDVKAQAADNAKQDLALDAWARHFGMTVSDEEVSEEFVKAGVDDPKKLEEDWRRNGQLHMVREGVLRTKAVKDVMDKANVTEAKEEPEPKKAAKKSSSNKSTAKKSSSDEEPKKSTKKASKKQDKSEEAEQAPADAQDAE